MTTDKTKNEGVPMTAKEIRDQSGRFLAQVELYCNKIRWELGNLDGLEDWQVMKIEDFSNSAIQRFKELQELVKIKPEN